MGPSLYLCMLLRPIKDKHEENLTPGSPVTYIRQ
jgi:hypothetical protein